MTNQKTTPICRYANPIGMKLSALPWKADRATVATALRCARRRGLVRRRGLGSYLLIGPADQLVDTRIISA